MTAWDGRAVTGQPGFWRSALPGRLRVEAALARERLAPTARLGSRAAVGLGPGAYPGGLGLLSGWAGAGPGAAVAGVWRCGRRLAVGWEASG